MRLQRLAIGAGAVALALTGCTSTSSPAASGRTVQVTMVDNSFQPDRLDVRKGETITFRFTNKGAVKHEAVIGDDAMQAEHHEEMMRSTGSSSTAPQASGMEHGGAKPGASAATATIEPGATAELTRTFAATGTLLIGCHEPGHYESGMKVNLNVT